MASIQSASIERMHWLVVDRQMEGLGSLHSIWKDATKVTICRAPGWNQEMEGFVEVIIELEKPPDTPAVVLKTDEVSLATSLAVLPRINFSSSERLDDAIIAMAKGLENLLPADKPGVTGKAVL
ncbi:MAG: hypothetical protein V4731_17520 [Pseudomonadota bacterium]